MTAVSGHRRLFMLCDMVDFCTVNVNGIRAAARRGGVAWLESAAHDVVLLQEVRASPDQLATASAGWTAPHVACAESQRAGRAGVAIVSRLPLREVRTGFGVADVDDTGRWVEAVVATDIGDVRVVSVYVHSGEADTDKQVAKYRFLDVMSERMATLLASGERVFVAGDINIAHTPRDIKNAKGNRGKAGFLPEEQAYLSSWLDAGWVDLGRAHAGDVDGPYTWWTWRGQAFDRDVGWRIDYGYATPVLAALLGDVKVERAASYEERWSDHAPVVFSFAEPGQD